MSNDSEARGTIGQDSYFHVVPLPAIWSEWIALIPLAVYLASYGVSHSIVGKTALGEFISVGFFPKIGVLGTIVDLLRGTSEYIDRACSVGEFRRVVWDVNWGSEFPSANGSASDIITKYALRKSGRPISTAAGHANGASSDVTAASQSTDVKHQFRRMQTLHVLRCTRKKDKVNSSRSWTKVLADVLVTIVIIIGTVLSYLYGLYGTFAALLISIAFGVSRLFIKVRTPSSYLEDNEAGRVPGCMLVAVHENASTWYLYTGERGIIDGVLNKSMIYSVEASYGESGTFCLVWFLRFLSLLQLLDLTFVAAQKGWDGVGLLIFILVAWITEALVYSEHHMGKIFLQRYNIDITAKTFEFTGRTAMLGAIQLYKENPVHTWMDRILADSDRRKIWLEILSDPTKDPSSVLGKKLDPADQSWITENYSWSMEAAKVLQRELSAA